MSVFVYIIRSEKTGRYYIGQSEDVQIRLLQHNAPDNTEYTKRDQPWQLVRSYACGCRAQARKIEQHIKNMKSKKYIEDMLIYPEIFEKLKTQYPCI